jgi:DNA-binding IclR family transcriptional regulator
VKRTLPGAVATAAASSRAGTPLNQSIERAARLLGFFTPERPELTLSELTARLGSSKATAHRYAVALRRAGLLRYEPARHLYTLGPRIVELAATALSGLRIIQIAGPHMERLVSDVNETVVLSIWDGEAPVVMRVEDNTDRIARIVVRTGTRLPIVSAQGKVFCAFGGEAPTVEVRPEEIEAIRAAGIAFNSQIEQGIRAIATPVFQETELAAAMALVGTTASIPDAPHSPPARKLREAAELLSAELGFLPDERRR